MNKRNETSLIRATTREYWNHAWQYPWLAGGLLFFVPLAVITYAIIPQLFISKILQKITNHAYVSGDLWASFGSQLLGYVLCSFVGGLFIWRIAIILVWSLEMRVLRDIYQRIFTHLTAQSLGFHADRFGGSIVSQSNKFATSYIRLVDTVIFDLYTLLITFIATFVIIYPRSPQIAIGLMVLSFVFIVISTLMTKKVRVLRAKEAEAENKQTGYLADAVTNILSIKSFAGERHENKRFAKITENVRSRTRDVMVTSMTREVGFAFGTFVVQMAAVIGALIAIVYGKADVATMYLAITYTGMITMRLWEFAQHTLKQLNRAFGDAEEMTKILALKPEIQDSSSPETSRISRGDVIWRNVQFTHSGSKEKIFVGLNLHIKPGEKVGLVGPSGSGKTTFTRLLQRFSDIQEGEILIDGQNITDIRQSDLRENIAFVPQEPLLFHRSIAENIAYGHRGNSSLDAVQAVAKMASAHEFVTDLPQGYDTLVGERGVKLSGGQRQRIAIARAMLKNAPILVLDEATSALDSESEVLIQDALWRLMEGRTAIVIAHRLSTIQKMDRIIVLDEGKIVEEGSHKELLAKNGTYAKLWSHQSGGFIED
ncbi:MAG: transporter ATP-binding protein [Patescibacteria group bacterium]|nr:transporter ATP-binding protein [Patescibacteria group bacterium]